jgi:hypothetical protein
MTFLVNGYFFFDVMLQALYNGGAGKSGTQHPWRLRLAASFAAMHDPTDTVLQ